LEIRALAALCEILRLEGLTLELRFKVLILLAVGFLRRCRSLAQGGSAFANDAKIAKLHI
jgi:hypothetical protein